MLSNKRNFVLKCTLVGVFLYLCIHLFSNSGTPSIFRELQQQSGRNLAALDTQNILNAEINRELVNIKSEYANVVPTTRKTIEPSVVVVPTTKSVVAPEVTSPSLTTVYVPSVSERVKQATKCLDRTMLPKTQQRGDYWVLYNYIRAEKRYRCEESITYTTHADYSFLDNLIPLMERWKGPVSIAIHAPGADFQNTLDSIAYLRDCSTPLIKELVTFHIYFSTKHVPKQVS